MGYGILLVVFQFFKASVVFAEGEQVIEGEGVTVVFDRTLRSGAEEVIRIYPETKKEIEEILELAVRFRPIVLLFKETERFRNAAGSDFVVAFAVPEKNLIAIDHSRIHTNPFSIEATLKHELCHLVLHDYIRVHPIPRWLDEGIAQWISGGIGEFLLEQRGAPLNEAVLSGGLIRLDSLYHSFPGDKTSLILAYQESKSWVNFVVEEFGRDRLIAIIKKMGEKELEEAVQETLSLSLKEIEKRWYAHLKKRMTWLSFIATHLYEILFLLGALATVYGFVRSIVRKRAYRDEEMNEDP